MLEILLFAIGVDLTEGDCRESVVPIDDDRDGGATAGFFWVTTLRI